MPDVHGDVSHSEIIAALGWKENINEHLRNFVRVQCADWKISSFEFDEEQTLPGWVEENREEIKSIVKKALLHAAHALAEYEKGCAPAWAEYEKVCAHALAEYEKGCAAHAWAEYEKVRAHALAEYEKVCAHAWAEYEKVRAPAWAEKEKGCAPALAEYEKGCDHAWAEYEKVRAPAWERFHDRLASISGFVE